MTETTNLEDKLMASLGEVIERDVKYETREALRDLGARVLRIERLLQLMGKRFIETGGS